MADGWPDTWTGDVITPEMLGRLCYSKVSANNKHLCFCKREGDDNKRLVYLNDRYIKIWFQWTDPPNPDKPDDVIKVDLDMGAFWTACITAPSLSDLKNKSEILLKRGYGWSTDRNMGYCQMSEGATTYSMGYSGDRTATTSGEREEWILVPRILADGNGYPCVRVYLNFYSYDLPPGMERKCTVLARWMKDNTEVTLRDVLCGGKHKESDSSSSSSGDSLPSGFNEPHYGAAEIGDPYVEVSFAPDGPANSRFKIKIKGFDLNGGVKSAESSSIPLYG